MPAVQAITRFRKRHQLRVKRGINNHAAKASLAGILVLIFLLGLTILGFALAYSYLTADLPSPLMLQTLLDPNEGMLNEPTRFYDRTGKYVLATLENPAASRRRYLSIKDSSAGLPKNLINATIAALDPDFWTHHGYAYNWPLHDSRSTLAQRLVSNFLLWEETPGFRRSFREWLLAAQVTRVFGREKILEWYLNHAHFGNWAVGADAAALSYFGKHAPQLTLSEAALLAGLLEAPALNPINTPRAALEAKNIVLDLMFAQGLLGQEEYQRAKNQQVTFRPAQSPDWKIPPAFVNLLLDQVSDYFPSDRLLQGGMQIISSVDYNLQYQAECAAELQLSRLMGEEHIISHQTELDCETGRLLTSPNENIRVQNLSVASEVIIHDPVSGQVLAYYSSLDRDSDSFDIPIRSPGTILTPYIYLTAFSHGMSPATMIWDIPAEVGSGSEDLQNPDGRYHGPVRLRTALANDYLIPASRLLDQFGMAQVLRTAHLMGFNDLGKLSDNKFSTFLDRSEVTLLELNQAFGVLANQGVKSGLKRKGRTTPELTPFLQPLAILKVSDRHGNVLLDCTNYTTVCQLATEHVISPQLAYLLTHVLSDEPARWPSLGHPNPLEIGRPAAAKLGQTTSGTDTWAVGYTPKLVVGIWLGATQGEESLSPLWAAGLWHALTQFSTRDQPVQDWSVPAGITRVTVCDPSGLLPTRECPNLVNEIFITGTEPTHYDNLFRNVQVNRETGRLATIFTPVEQIEERIFLTVPPEAKEWAEQAGLPVLPEAIDAISRFPDRLPSARIDSPVNFSTIGGKVTIMGRASGSGFRFYRIQVGQGINPQTWLQIGQDHSRAVEDGLLAIWDTEKFNGLYVLQLLVVGENNRVEVGAIQVTVDNHPPELKVDFPMADQVFNYPATRTITFLADAKDDLQLAHVEFYLDGKLISNRKAPPFVHPWDASLGQHHLIVRAVDLAGNTSEAEVNFTVTR